jgi:hypothetical protein
MNTNSNLKSKYNSIKNDVENLFKKIDDPNEKMFERHITTDINITGYHDPSDLYRTTTGNDSIKVKKNNSIISEQNRRMGIQDNIRIPSDKSDIRYDYDNRHQGFPPADINQYNDIRKAYVENNTGQPFMNASQRNSQLIDDTLLNKSRSKSNGKQKNIEKLDNERRSPKDRDNRFNYYPDQNVSSYATQGQKKDSNFINPNDTRNLTGDVFTHNKERDRVPINPKDVYRGSQYESTPYNSLDKEVTYDIRKKSINAGQVNYPTGDVFTHNSQRDRVPIDPTLLYRNSDYGSNEYNQNDIDVNMVPNTSKISGTADYILNREFDIVNDNRTSKDEQNEKTMIHTPYTTLDKFDKPNVVFKNINMDKPQVDVLNEFIINIDSADRNTTYYPSQFKMRVLFNPNDDATNADLKIPRAFENIKYLRLETTTFPRYYVLKLTTATSATPILGDANEQTILSAIIANINTYKHTNSSDFQQYVNSVGGTYTPPTNYITQYVGYIYTSNTNINAKFNIVNPSGVSTAYELLYNGTIAQTISNRYIIDTTKDLSKDRFLTINLDEITDNTQNSTSGKNQYNYLYPDYITDKYFYGDNHFVDKIFKNAKLGEIKTLTISFRDSFGTQIQGGKYIDTVSSTTDKFSTTDTTNVTTVYNDSITYIRHPYYRDFQLSLMFKVGCYETEIDKKIFY